MVPTGRTSSSSGISGTRMITIIPRVWVSNPAGCNSNSSKQCSRDRLYKTTIRAAWALILSTITCISNNNNNNYSICTSSRFSHNNSSICCSNRVTGITSWRPLLFNRVLVRRNRHCLGHHRVAIPFGQSRRASLIVAAV